MRGRPTWPGLLSLLLFLALPASASGPGERAYDVLHYRVAVRLREAGAFHNTATLTLVPQAALSSLELDVHGLHIQAVRMGEGTPARFELKALPQERTGTLRVLLPRALVAGQPVELEVEYEGRASPVQEGFFSILDEGRPGALPYFFTEFEPSNARRFIPSNDVPHDKATSELIAVVDARYQVLSNGRKVLDEVFSEEGVSLRRVHWKQELPHPLYAVALAIGQFEQRVVDAKVPSTFHLPPGRDARSSRFSLDVTRRALVFQQALLGVKYPWAKYDVVALPHYSWGGMENTSLVFAREDGLVLEHPDSAPGQALQVSLASHELAHQWFGNSVTCRTWNDTWLNEGLATYVGQRTEEHILQNELIRVRRAVGSFVFYFREDGGPRARPLVTEQLLNPEEAFGGISNVKGAHVLRMLEQWLGEEALLRGLRRYLTKHALGNADSGELFAALADEAREGAGLGAFQDSWLRQKGYPVLSPGLAYADGVAAVTVAQRPSHADESRPFVFKLPVVFHRERPPAYHERRVLVIDRSQVSLSVPLPAEPDWVNWNEGGSALARIEPTAVTREAWLAGARRDPDPVWRMLAWFELIERAAAGGAESATLWAALAEALETDPSPYVREEVLLRLGARQGRFVPRELGPALLALAKKPRGLPRKDAMGMAFVRRAAQELLGKVDHPEGHRYLTGALRQEAVEFNFLGSLAIGVARMGSPEALESLRHALQRSRARGPLFFKEVAPALGAFESAAVIPVLRETIPLLAGYSQSLHGLIQKLSDNATFKSSPEGSALVRDFVLHSQEFGDEQKARMLRVLDDVKTDDARRDLEAIVRDSGSPRLRTAARKTLDKNFPSREP